MLLIAGVLLVAGVAQAKELSPREVYEQVSPAVVMVMGHPESGKSGKGGTGSIIHADGLVLTNAHVIIEDKTGKPYPRLSVFLKPARVTGDSRADLARQSRAKVLAYSSHLDLALLKLENISGPLPTIALSQSEGTRIGDRVLAIGHPEQGGLWTLTTGVISAEIDNFNGVKGKHVFQTETGLNRGNSGGPLVNSDGEMVGVNTAIAHVADDGLPIASISFSLKSDVARQWVNEQKISIQSSIAQSGTQTMKSATAVPPTLANPPRPSASAQKPDVTVGPTGKVGSVEPLIPARPYNLDQLVTERSKVEADLDNMMSEMRGRVTGR
jgi:serine protease Do